MNRVRDRRVYPKGNLSLLVLMKHVMQKDEIGCLVAVTAMVLDLEYDEVKNTVPLQDPEFQKQGVNYLGGQAFDEIQKLAQVRGKQFDDVFPPFVCEKGVRYVAVLRSTASLLHALAIDESGQVFDPLCACKPSSEYDFIAMMGCFAQP
jgi:hypothetical protein